MRVLKSLLGIFFLFSISFAQINEVDELFEKVNQANTPEEKKLLIEKLKIKLAKENKKKREEADAIIKAKEKIPNKIYNEIPLPK